MADRMLGASYASENAPLYVLPPTALVCSILPGSSAVAAAPSVSGQLNVAAALGAVR
jgi:hypothetical protein